MPETLPAFGHFHITLDGTPLAEAAHNAVTEVRVEQALHLPDLCLLRIADDDLRLTDENTLAIGKALKVEIGENRNLKPVFEGEITGVELTPTAPGGAFMLLVRAYDKSHRLHRGKHTRTYIQATDSDIATQLAREAGLRPQVDATSEVYEYLLQDNQSYYRFLLERADRIGYAFWVEGQTLYFKRPGAAEGAPVELKWGETLSDFHVALTVGQQVDEVNVRGWDPKDKKAIVGRATRSQASPRIGETQTGGQVAQQAFGAAKSIAVQRPVATQAEADALAQALFDELNAAFVRAEGETIGNPELRPGKPVQLGNVGQRFGGTYYLTEVIHEIDARQGYRTRFKVSGRQADTLLDLISPRAPETRPWVCVGIVTNNQDPDGMGRVKVQFPWLDDQVESTWARVAAPMAGQGRGFYFLPEVNDEVLVAFEQGDVRRPYVLGVLWGGKDGLPSGGDGAVSGSGQVVTRMLHTRAGHKIILDDSDGGGGITLEDKSGNKVVLDATSGAGGITLEDKNGNRLVLDAAANALTIEVQGNFKLKASGTVQIEGQGGVQMKSSGQIVIKGATINLN